MVAPFPLTRLSGRLIDTLQRQRRVYSATDVADQFFANDELFVFSRAATLGRFSVGNLRDHAPAFFADTYFQTNPDIIDDSLRNRPPGLYHPVRAREDYHREIGSRIAGLPRVLNILAPSMQDLGTPDAHAISAAFGAALARQLAAPPVPEAATAARGVLAIKTCMPEAGRETRTGDWHFGASLAAAMQAQGQPARVDEIGDWAGAPADDWADLVIQGHDTYLPRPGIRCAMWLIYPGKRFDLACLADYDHVFVASRRHLERLSRRVPQARLSYLPQAFDARLMYPPAGNAPRAGIVFVGNNHFGKPRPVVQAAHDAGLTMRIWGGGWAGTPQADQVQGNFVANEQLGDVYRGAEIVLCDHTRVMAGNGYLSNRAYDVLACATPLVLDGVAAMPRDLLPFVKVVSSPEELAAAVAEIRAEGPEMRAKRLAFARSMPARHSFDARASEILSVISQRQAELAS